MIELNFSYFPFNSNENHLIIWWICYNIDNTGGKFIGNHIKYCLLYFPILHYLFTIGIIVIYTLIISYRPHGKVALAQLIKLYKEMQLAQAKHIWVRLNNINRT